jgi:hypothetical protein
MRTAKPLMEPNVLSREGAVSFRANGEVERRGSCTSEKHSTYHRDRSNRWLEFTVVSNEILSALREARAHFN